MLKLINQIFFNVANHRYNFRGHKLHLIKTIGNNCYENVFTNRCINCWNCLPSDIVNSVSVTSFKNKLNNFNLKYFTKGRALVDF